MGADYIYILPSRMTSEMRRDESQFNVLLIVRDEVTRVGDATDTP